MPKYGIIKDGKLITSDKKANGYKLIEYAKIPEFDQMTQAVYQGEITEDDDKIHVGNEIKEVEIDDDEFEDDIF